MALIKYLSLICLDDEANLVYIHGLGSFLVSCTFLGPMNLTIAY